MAPVAPEKNAMRIMVHFKFHGFAIAPVASRIHTTQRFL